MAELEDGQVELQIEATRSADPHGVATIGLSGELDSSNVEQLEAVVSSILAERPTRVILDMRALRFMDSAGISVLVGLAGKVDTVQIRDPSPIVRRVIEITGLTGVLQVEP
jgi:anti-sigma B factor antagonist